MWPRRTFSGPCLVLSGFEGAEGEQVTPEQPNWKKWGRCDQLELWQAVALACAVAPESLGIDNPEYRADRRTFWYDIAHPEAPGFDEKLDIARSHVGGSLVALRLNEESDLRLRCFSIVRLLDFSAWAVGEGWQLPSEFPIPMAVRSGHVDWSVWRHRPQAELWEVVAASLGIVPDSLIEPNLDFDPQSPFLCIPEQFRGRLAIAEAHLGEDLKAVKIVEKKRRKYFSTVRVADFVGWFEALHPPLQPPLPVEFPKAAPQLKRIPAEGAWPWGTYETGLLKHLAAAVQEFWTKYDPAKPRTAPTNDRVVNWLKGRKVPMRTAQIIAKIIRDEKAPHGPRPSAIADED